MDLLNMTNRAKILEFFFFQATVLKSDDMMVQKLTTNAKFHPNISKIMCQKTQGHGV